MGPLEFLTDRGAEGLSRFYSCYRGVVVENEDPDGQNRVRVVVPQIDNTSAVWAYPRNQMAYNRAGIKTLTPPITSMVWVEYEFGDRMYPVWSHGHFAVDEMPAELLDNKVMGIVTPNLNKLLIDENNNNLKISIINSSGEDPLDIEIQDGVLSVRGLHINLLDAKIGIPKSDNVTERLNKIEQDINQLKQLLAAAPNEAIPLDGGKAALSTLSTWAGQVLIETKVDDIANEKILQ